MVGAVCAAEATGRAGRTDYGTIAVIGGGCYGSWYVRQLCRARAAGALNWSRVLVVDRNPECPVAELITGEAAAEAHGIEIVRREWSDFIGEWLAGAADDDALVPSPLMPHLLFDWLLARARERWPDRAVERMALPAERPPSTPWQRASPEGTHYVSFAEWTCPINCIEPPLCPVIRGPRTWSLPPAVRAYADAERRRGHVLEGPLLFHCTHRAYGVGMIDARDALDADRRVRDAGTSGPARVLVGTVSHCHGALDLLEIGSAAGQKAKQHA